MTAFIILREVLLKNNNIGVIKSLKLMNFKCKKNLRKYSRSRSTFRNKFDPSLELLLLRYFRECKCVLNEIHSFAEVSKRRVFPFIDYYFKQGPPVVSNPMSAKNWKTRKKINLKEK